MHQRLEEKISAWREEIAASESIGSEGLRELESHLRDAIDGELGAGATLAEALTLLRAEVDEQLTRWAERLAKVPDEGFTVAVRSQPEAPSGGTRSRTSTAEGGCNCI